MEYNLFAFRIAVPMDRLDCIKVSCGLSKQVAFLPSPANSIQPSIPTISKQSAALEDYLDVQLLNRSNRKLHLTQREKDFLSIARGNYGQVEGQNNRLKMLKRKMFERAGLDLLAKRFILKA